VSVVFRKTLDNLMRVEGGYVFDPRDSGGETYRGIARRFWPDWLGWARVDGHKTEEKRAGQLDRLLASDAALQELVAEFYEVNFWSALRCDAVSVLSVPVAVELFDTGVNCGIETAGRILQRGLNALNDRGRLYHDLIVDGDIGERTIEALRQYLLARPTHGEGVLLKIQNALQGAHYIELAERRQKDEAFVYGWFWTRIELPRE
jgi:lysozyme family protein